MPPVLRPKRSDDSLPAIPGGPYDYTDARIAERLITEEAVRQYTGPVVLPSYSETDTTGTFTLAVLDPAHTVDTSLRIQFEQDGTVENPTTEPAAGIVNGTYTFTFTKDPKHVISVAYLVHLRDGTTFRSIPKAFDKDRAANVENVAQSVIGNTDNFTVTFDTDVAVGTNKGQYSLDSGTTWTGFNVGSDLTGTFAITITGSAQTVLVRGLNAAGSAGPSVKVDLPTAGVSLVAMVQFSSTEAIITWGGVNVTLSIDGGTFATPPSDDDPVQAGNQLTIALDANPHTYVFQSTVNGQTSTAPVHVPALGSIGSIGGAFSSLTNAVVDYTANTVRFGWSWSGDSSASFNVYVSEGGAPYARVGGIPTTSSGATSYVYTTTADIKSTISPTVDIGFYVEAVVGSTILGARSVPLVTTYGT